jgi:hypothetical protein
MAWQKARQQAAATGESPAGSMVAPATAIDPAA